MILRTKSLARRGKDGAPRLCLPELEAWRGRADAPAGDDRPVLGDVGGGLQDPSAGDLRPPQRRLKVQHAASGRPDEGVSGAGRGGGERGADHHAAVLTGRSGAAEPAAETAQIDHPGGSGPPEGKVGAADLHLSNDHRAVGGDATRIAVAIEDGIDVLAVTCRRRAVGVRGLLPEHVETTRPRARRHRAVHRYARGVPLASTDCPTTTEPSNEAARASLLPPPRSPRTRYPPAAVHRNASLLPEETHPAPAITLPSPEMPRACVPQEEPGIWPSPWKLALLAPLGGFDVPNADDAPINEPKPATTATNTTRPSGRVGVRKRFTSTPPWRAGRYRVSAAAVIPMRAEDAASPASLLVHVPGMATVRAASRRNSHRQPLG